MTLPREHLLAFRLSGHHLDTKLPPGSEVQAASGGLQDPVPGTAALSLRARVAGTSLDTYAQALATDKSLVRLWSLRVAPYVVPAADLAPFTLAVAPDGEEALATFTRMMAGHFKQIGLAPAVIITWASAALDGILGGRHLPKNQLVAEVAYAVEQHLNPTQRAAWHQEASNQTVSLGHAVIALILRALSLDARFCFAADRTNPRAEPPHVRLDEWLGHVPLLSDVQAARSTLLRLFLRQYGPATPTQFAAWAGLPPVCAREIWALEADSLVPARLGKKTLYIHADDEARFKAPAPPRGVRILPPYDSYLASPDRDALVPDKSYHREVWRPAGNPGVLLVDGEVVAIWKPGKAGQKAVIKISPIRPFADAARRIIQEEASQLAPYRGGTSCEARFMDEA